MDYVSGVNLKKPLPYPVAKALLGIPSRGFIALRFLLGAYYPLELIFCEHSFIPIFLLVCLLLFYANIENLGIYLVHASL